MFSNRKLYFRNIIEIYKNSLDKEIEEEVVG